jgi:carbonic anhydrase
MLIHHTDCGILTFGDDDFRRQVQEETGIKPEWPAEAFDDLERSASRSPASRRARSSRRTAFRGFVYDVETGALREVP